MENEESRDPASTSNDEENGRTITAMDEGQGSSSNPTEPRETDIQEEAEFDYTGPNDRTSNEMDKNIRDMIANLEEIGPTISSYQYDEASKEVQRLATEMKEKAMATMIHYLQLEDEKNFPISQKGQRVPRQAAVQKDRQLSPTFLEMEVKLKELEKQSNKVARRIKEHKREQAHTMEKLQTLEARALLEEKRGFIKDILTRVPTETDMQNLETIRLMLMERKRTESRIQLLDMRASALDKAMAAVAKSKWFGGQQVERTLDTLTSPSFRPVSSRDINGGVDSREIGSREIGSREIGSREIGSREIGSRESGSREIGSREALNAKLPDFTKMSAAKRESFLAKNFTQRVSPDSQSNQNRGSSLIMKKTRQGSLNLLNPGAEEIKPNDDLQKGSPEKLGNEGGNASDHSGVTIVTMSSDETDVPVSGRQQTSESGSPVDNDESQVTEGLGAPSDPSGEGAERNPNRTQ